jgi:O-antigen ligase
MTGLASIAGIRDMARRHHVLTVAYIGFLSLILIIPDPQIHRWIYYAAVLPAFVLTVDRSTLFAVTQSSVWRVAVALLLCLWLSVLWGENPNLRDAIDVARHVIMITLFITVTASLAMLRPAFPRLLFRCLLAAAALIVLASLVWQGVQAGGVILRPTLFTIPSPNVAGAVYGALIMGALFYALPETHSPLKRNLIVGGLVVMVLFIGLSQSRGNLLSLAGGLLILTLLARVREAAIALVVGIVVTGTLLATGLLDSGELVARGLSYRPEAWQYYLGLWMERPLLGLGLNVNPTFVSSDYVVKIHHPDSIYIAPLLHAGVPGFALFMLTLVAAARAAWRAHQRKGDLGLLAMLIFVALTGTVEFTLLIEDADWQWVLLWLPIGLIVGAEARERAAASP